MIEFLTIKTQTKYTFTLVLALSGKEKAKNIDALLTSNDGFFYDIQNDISLLTKASENLPEVEKKFKAMLKKKKVKTDNIDIQYRIAWGDAEKVPLAIYEVHHSKNA